ncbi:MAG: LysM peptidoglycan-binding domain-containing protein [Spirosomataceae bacterium]|jgi:LysM repeat protein
MNKILSLTLLIFVLSCSFSAKSQNNPNLDTEIRNNLVFIKHKVVAGETLYSLINKFEAKNSEVLELNPELKKDPAIKVGQELIFPMMKNGKHVSAEGYKKGQKPEKAKVKSKSEKYHEVKAGETIFSLAKEYDLDISYLVEANDISDNLIKIGQKLLIDKTEIEKIGKKLEEESKKEVLEVKPVGKKHKEQGVAEVISTGNRTTKNLVMHRTAPIGTIITITNEATGNTINARVVGNLKKVGADQDVMIKLSPFAYYKLRPRDSRIRASIEYYTSK